MTDDKRPHFSSSSATEGSDLSSSAVQNGAFVVEAVTLRRNIQADASHIPDDTTVSIGGEAGTKGEWSGGAYNTTVTEQGTSNDITVVGGLVTSVHKNLWPLSPTTNTYPGSATVIVAGAGNVINGATASSGGAFDVGKDGHIDNATAFAGGTVAATAAGAVVDGGTASGGQLVVNNGGTLLAGDKNHNISGGTVGVGGVIVVENGGTFTGVNIQAGATEIAGTGGSIMGGTIAAGMEGDVAGGTMSGITISGVGSQSAAAVINVPLDGGTPAIVNVSNGGTLSDARIINAGTVNVSAGGTVLGGYLSGNSAQIKIPLVNVGVASLGRAVINVSDGGLMRGGTVDNLGTAYASSGGIVSGAVAQNSGILQGGSGGTVGGTILNGGTVMVSAGGIVSSATLFNGGTLYSNGGSGVVAGATYNSITFESGQVLSMGTGSMSNVTASSGAAVAVFGSGHYIDGGTATGNADVSSSAGASIDALNGGTIYNGVAGSGGIIAAGGVAGAGGNGTSLLADAHIMNGGLGIVGGNKNLTVTKHGTTVTLNGAGVSSDAVVDAGGLLDINSKGTEIGGEIAGTAVIESGGTISGALFSGANEDGHGAGSGYVDSGATANANTVEGGATLTFNGGVGTGNTAQAGGVIDVGGGGSWSLDPRSQGVVVGAGTMYGTASETVLSSGGIMSVRSGGSAMGVDVHSNATIIVNSGAYASGATIGAGEDKWAGSGGTVIDPNTGGAYVSSGGLLSGATLVNGSGTGSKVDEMGGLLRVERGATVTGLVMGDYGQIEVMGVSYGAGESVTYQNGSITLMSNGHAVWGASLAGGPYNGTGFQVWDDNGTATIVYDVCFLKGTLIATPKGDIEVQNLGEGDFIWAIENGEEVARPIRGLHRGESSIDRRLPTDLAGWSVCVRAGAFGDHLPNRDLRVTPEHCFFFEGKFIPVRMLVNGSSIYYDTSLENFEYFHFETEPHAIIRAEGVLTESWLNTKERRRSVNLANNVTRLERIPSRTWEKDAAAPLDVSPAFAEKLWNHFHVRSLQRGIETIQSQQILLNKNPDLRLCFADGREISPVNRRGNKYFFQLPAGIETKEIYLKSKIFRPSESIGPWIDDRRQLGVLVGRILVAVGEAFHAVDTHLHHANAQGWDVVENSPCRWTKGNALLPALGTEEALRFGASLIIDVLAGGPYPERKETAKMTVLSGASFG